MTGLEEAASDPGHEAERIADSIDRRLNYMEAASPSIADYLLDRQPGHGIDFAKADRVLARLDSLLKEDPNVRFWCSGAWAPVAGHHDMLAHALMRAEPFRKLKQ